MDYIIVGQGLAGSCLALELIKRGKEVVVIDKFNASGSSRVAAGLINPITGKRLAKSVFLEESLPVAKAFYEEQEARFGRPFFFPKEIARIFASEDEVKIYNKKRNNPDYVRYLSNPLPAGHWGGAVRDPLGSFVIKEGGYVDTIALLDAIRGVLNVRNEVFDFDALEVGSGRVVYKDVEASKIYFCEGAGIVRNPYFKHLPMELAKGEILTLRLEAELPQGVIFNQGAWLLPIGGGLYRAGSTYEWEDLDTEPTESARADILRRVEAFCPGMIGCEVVDHKAGVRPSSKARVPFMAVHEEHPELVVVNGFGSKGSLWAPGYAATWLD